MQLEPVIFGSMFEAIFQGLSGRLDEQRKGLVLAAGVDPDNLLTAYSIDTFHSTMQALHQAFYPSMSRDNAMYQLGRDYILGMKSTVIGRAIYAMATLIGPRRTLERMTKNARTSNNFSTTSLETLPDGALRMYTSVPAEFEPILGNKSISPHYFRGILKEALAQTGAPNAVVTLEREEPALTRAWYRIELKS